MMKVNYGIYLGTSSASIAKMENGSPVILRSDNLKDSTPVFIYVNKKGAIQVGDSAFNAHKTDILKSQRDWSSSSNNSFIEFTRTLGTDKTYHSSNTNKSFNSTELVAEIFKMLISFEKCKDVNAAVITIPDSFKFNQTNAVREAGELAGLQQVEIFQESIAASLAYGLDSVKFQGFSLVFSFSDNFNISLMKNKRIIDTEGENYLGDKDLDFAIVDQIILPYIQDNFVIDSILADDTKKQTLRNALVFYAEDAKKKLSYNENHEILSDLGGIPGEDDEGEEFDLDITVTQADITKALSPVFQKAIDVSIILLERNNLRGSDLDSLILVGGPTLSPVLRTMLEEQICKPDTSIDPKTAIAKGAALYASTIDVSEEAKKQKSDKTKIQLEIANEPSTVETEQYVPIKILADKTDAKIPEKVFAEFTRSDKTWSSGKIEIDTIGEVIEVALNEGKTNIFEIVLFDKKGKRLESEPGSFRILHTHLINLIRLPYNIGTEVKDKTTGKIIFRTIQGLEKNQSIPAVGTYNGIKTEFPIRPGIESDFIKIPIYEGEHGAEGTRAIYNEHILDVIISGADLPTLLPENSTIDLMINIDKSVRIIVTAYFPYLDFTYETSIERAISSIETDWLSNEIKKAKGSISELKQDESYDHIHLQKIERDIDYLESSFEKNKNDIDCKKEVLTNLRKSLKTIDELNETAEWPKLEKELKEEFYRLEKVNNDLGNDKTTQVVNQLRSQLKEVIKAKDVKLGNVLLEEIEDFFSVYISSTSIETVEDLLFELTENEVISSSEFQNYFEQLSKLKKSPDVDTLQEIFTQLKTYGRKA